MEQRKCAQNVERQYGLLQRSQGEDIRVGRVRQELKVHARVQAHQEDGGEEEQSVRDDPEPVLREGPGQQIGEKKIAHKDIQERHNRSRERLRTARNMKEDSSGCALHAESDETDQHHDRSAAGASHGRRREEGGLALTACKRPVISGARSDEP